MASITIRDVARKAGVGVGTVSRVLNDNPSVSPSTREKVLSAIAELEYQPNPIARRLSLGKTLTIAVIAPFFTRPAFVQRFRGIESVLSESEYDFVMYNVESAARRDYCFREVPRRDRIDGLLIMSLIPDSSDARRFQQANIPTVLLDASHKEFNRVIIDDLTGGYIATKHLLDLGHRHIGYISDILTKTPFNYHSIFERFQGYQNALNEAGVPFKPHYVLQGDVNQNLGRRLAKQLLTQNPEITAIFAYSDTHAIGALQAARELGLRVPEDLSLIGYDDIEISEYLHLTTIQQKLVQSGVQAAKLLLEEIDHPSAQPREIISPTELICRNTTAPPTS